MPDEKKATGRRHLAENLEPGDEVELQATARVRVLHSRREGDRCELRLGLLTLTAKPGHGRDACGAPFEVAVRDDGRIEMMVSVEATQRLRTVGLSTRRRRELLEGLAELSPDEAAALLKRVIKPHPEPIPSSVPAADERPAKRQSNS